MRFLLNVVVHVANWEYQCCGTVPRVGAELSGTLTVFESEAPAFLAPPVTGFDARSGLVRMGPVVAQLGAGLSEPVGDLVLGLGWHDRDARPRITGVVERVHEETGRFLSIGADRTLRIDPRTRRFHSVEAATRWPEERLESGGEATIGVAVELRVTELREPTEAEIDERLADEERARRTVHLTGPLEVFGPTVPPVGSSIEVDLGDERLDKGGLLAGLTRTVRGEVLQASALSRGGAGPAGEIFGVVYVRPDPLIPPDELMVRLLIDPESAGDSPRL